LDKKNGRRDENARKVSTVKKRLPLRELRRRKNGFRIYGFVL